MALGFFLNEPSTAKRINFWYEMPSCAARLRTAFNNGSENRRLTCLVLGNNSNVTGVKSLDPRVREDNGREMQIPRYARNDHLVC